MENLFNLISQIHNYRASYPILGYEEHSYFEYLHYGRPNWKLGNEKINNLYTEYFDNRIDLLKFIDRNSINKENNNSSVSKVIHNENLQKILFKYI